MKFKDFRKNHPEASKTLLSCSIGMAIFSAGIAASLVGAMNDIDLDILEDDLTTGKRLFRQKYDPIDQPYEVDMGRFYFYDKLERNKIQKAEREARRHAKYMASTTADISVSSHEIKYAIKDYWSSTEWD